MALRCRVYPTTNPPRIPLATPSHAHPLHIPFTSPSCPWTLHSQPPLEFSSLACTTHVYIYSTEHHAQTSTMHNGQRKMILGASPRTPASAEGIVLSGLPRSTGSHQPAHHSHTRSRRRPFLHTHPRTTCTSLVSPSHCTHVDVRRSLLIASLPCIPLLAFPSLACTMHVYIVVYIHSSEHAHTSTRHDRQHERISGASPRTPAPADSRGFLLSYLTSHEPPVHSMHATRHSLSLTQ